MCTERVRREVGVCVDALWRAVLQVCRMVRCRVYMYGMFVILTLLLIHVSEPRVGDDASTVM
jgi:hypothetical protein